MYEEYTYKIITEIAIYICNTEKYKVPVSQQNKSVFKILEYEHLKQAEMSVKFQLEFLRNNCSGCEYHSHHKYYENLRELRNSEPIENYFEFLVCFLAITSFTNEVAKLLLRIHLSDEEYLNVIPENQFQLVEEGLFRKIVHISKEEFDMRFCNRGYDDWIFRYSLF